ncbi:hypothetical protein N9B71_05705 [Pirellulales bacterium]|nr:hypothetical protein [Pirellulales bacterium]
MGTYNYTNRFDLEPDDFKLEVYDTKNSDVHLKFELGEEAIAALSGHPNARIMLEAYAQSRYERFDCGTISARKELDEKLIRFSKDDNVKFNVKIASEVENGLLVASADAIRPKKAKGANNSALIGIQIKPLDGVVYRLDFNTDDGEPVLLLDKKLDEELDIGITQSCVIDRVLRSIVWPSVFREVLMMLLMVERGKLEDENDPDWKCRWKETAQKFNNSSLPEWSDDDEERNERIGWIDEAVAAFSRGQNFCEPLPAVLNQRSGGE